MVGKHSIPELQPQSLTIVRKSIVRLHKSQGHVTLLVLDEETGSQAKECSYLQSRSSTTGLHPQPFWLSLATRRSKSSPWKGPNGTHPCYTFIQFNQMGPDLTQFMLVCQNSNITLQCPSHSLEVSLNSQLTSIAIYIVYAVTQTALKQLAFLYAFDCLLSHKFRCGILSSLMQSCPDSSPKFGSYSVYESSACAIIHTRKLACIQ